ncbi:MAG: serine/threonine-protein kinase [Polyangiaceae bacterium]
MSDLGNLTAGHVIDGRYQLESKLGEGGMGAVWRARHVSLKSPVAIKLINPSLASSESALQRFMLEAQSSAALRSTHIVQVFDFGVVDGVPYIAMELLHGESLADRLERVQRLGVNDTARIMTEVSRAVSLAHSAGVIHRDLKPDNIFLVQEAHGEVAKVLDFGIAKVTGGSFDATTDSGGTKTGTLIGTPHFVSPEQARGNKTVDLRSDLWALGVITYECLCGFRPFDSDGLGDLLMKICFEDPPPPSSQVQVPQGVDAWMARALAKDPNQRFQSATEMFEAFTALLSQPGLYASPADLSGPQRAQQPSIPSYPLATPDPSAAHAHTVATPYPGGGVERVTGIGPSAPTDAGLETNLALPRSRSAWPLVAIGLIVCLLGGGIALAVSLTRGNDAQQPAAASTTPEEASASTAPATPEVTPSDTASEDAETASAPSASATASDSAAEQAAPAPAAAPAKTPVAHGHPAPAKPAAAHPSPPKPAATEPAQPTAKPTSGAGLFDDRK